MGWFLYDRNHRREIVKLSFYSSIITYVIDVSIAFIFLSERKNYLHQRTAILQILTEHFR